MPFASFVKALRARRSAPWRPSSASGGSRCDRGRSGITYQVQAQVDPTILTGRPTTRHSVRKTHPPQQDSSARLPGQVQFPSTTSSRRLTGAAGDCRSTPSALYIMLAGPPAHSSGSALAYLAALGRRSTADRRLTAPLAALRAEPRAEENCSPSPGDRRVRSVGPLVAGVVGPPRASAPDGELGRWAGTSRPGPWQSASASSSAVLGSFGRPRPGQLGSGALREEQRPQKTASGKRLYLEGPGARGQRARLGGLTAAQPAFLRSSVPTPTRNLLPVPCTWFLAPAPALDRVDAAARAHPRTSVRG